MEDIKIWNKKYTQLNGLHKNGTLYYLDIHKIINRSGKKYIANIEFHHNRKVAIIQLEYEILPKFIEIIQFATKVYYQIDWSKYDYIYKGGRKNDK